MDTKLFMVILIKSWDGGSDFFHDECVTMGYYTDFNLAVNRCVEKYKLSDADAEELKLGEEIDITDFCMKENLYDVPIKYDWASILIKECVVNGPELYPIALIYDP